MKTGLTLNFGSMRQQIRQMIERAESAGKDVDNEAEKIVATITHKLEEETVKRMPVDEAMLEKSIRSKVEKGGKVHNTEGVVWIPANSPAKDYAMYMHELHYNLGQRSRLKQTTLPGITVGRKYMERAMDENTRAFSLYIIKKLKELIGD